MESPEVQPPADSLFPHSGMRLGQLDFYNDSKKAVQDGKILFANAPTGIGKTAASLCAALEEALPNGRKVVFLTNRNSHHIQVMVECRKIMEMRGGVLERIRPDSPQLRIVDKISKPRMCLLRARDPKDDSPMLLCEFSHCRHSKPTPDAIANLVEKNESAAENVKRSLAENYCAHYAALGAMSQADVIICDYSYLFEESIRGLFLSKTGLPLSRMDVIIDEAHNLPDRVRDINGREIGEKTMKNALRALSGAKECAKDDAEMQGRIAHAISYVRNSLSPSLKELVEKSTADREEIMLREPELELFEPERLGNFGLAGLVQEAAGKAPGAVSAKQRALSSVLDEIADFVRIIWAKPGSEKTTVDIEGLSSLTALASFLSIAEFAAEGAPEYGMFLKTSADKTLFRMRAILFDPSLPAKQVFAEVNSAILMSGTLLGKQGLCELLGIEEQRTAGLEDFAYSSPFDPERQRLRVCTWISSRQKDRVLPAKIKVMAGIIDEAARGCAPHSLAIFYPSYDYLRMVKDELELAGFRHETETRGEKRDSAEGRKGRIEERTFADKPIAFHGVVGGSYSEGIDFRNNPFKLIIIAGFPFPKPDAQHEAYENYLKLRLKNSRRATEIASIVPSAVKTMQAIGRGIRKAEDWCYCLLIDDRFSSYLNYFPKSLQTRTKNIGGNAKKEVWDDVYKFVERMDDARQDEKKSET
ncbi:MAG: ATP-dependent DNA helicase [Candidatus Micrarchaeota archaeon]|nr:ATP-dependent DNA helicase [Candidatus Micrarchaeota archaeon]